MQRAYSLKGQEGLYYPQFKVFKGKDDMRFFLLFVLINFLSGETLLKADSTSSSRIAAVVNNSIITKADLANRLRFAAISSGLEPAPENLERIKLQLLRVMIDEK